MNYRISEDQIKLISPEIQELLQLEDQKKLVEQRLSRMLSLIEPRFADRASGITFDYGTMSFSHPVPEMTTDGVSTAVPVQPGENDGIE